MICEILAGLFEFDNGGGPGRIAGDGAASEMNGGGNGLDRDQSLNNESANNISLDAKGDQSILIGASSNKRKELEPLSPRTTRKSKLPLNLGSPNIKRIKGGNNPVTQSVTSLNDINESADLSSATTTLEFILLSLSKSLGVKPK